MIEYREAPASDIAPAPVGHVHYEPSAPGATSLRDAKPLYIDGQHVTAEAYQGKITIFLGCKIIYTGPIPAEAQNSVNAWVARYAIAYVGPAPESDESAPVPGSGAMAQVQAAFDHANAVSDAPCTCDGYESCGACLAAEDAWDEYNALLEAAGIQDEDFRADQPDNCPALENLLRF
jgi:hypothetical protein